MTTALSLYAAPASASPVPGGSPGCSRVGPAALAAGADGVLAAAIAREADRIGGARRNVARRGPTADAGRVTAGFEGTSGPQASSTRHRSWIARHPVWFGTIVGAVGGAMIVGLAVDPEVSFVGFYGGAAVGAAIGSVAGK